MANNIETYSGKSIAQQLLGDTKLGKWLLGNNTYKDGGTIQKYQNPSGLITKQPDENKSWNERVDDWYEQNGVPKPLGSINNKHSYDVREYSGVTANNIKLNNDEARFILNHPPTYLSRSPESDISVIQNELNKGAIIDDKFVNRPSAKDALKLIEDDYYKFQSQLEHKERYKYDAPVDDSELVKITAPNTNKAKYIFGHKISKNLINDIRVAAIERDQDPYDVLAHVLIEGGGRYDNTIQSHDYFNTHDLIQKQFPNKYLWQNFDKQSILKNLGIYQDDPNYKYTFEQIMKAGRKHDSERSKVLNNVIVPKSTADAVALHMQLHGRDFNPKQKGLTLGDGTYMPKVTVRHNYLDMIDDGIKSLKENIPNLFKKQGGKLKLQPGGTITQEYAKLLGRRGMPGDKEALAAAGYDSKGRPLFTFGGGSFGAAGAGATFGNGTEQIDNHDYVRNTPILQSFSEAFNNARKSGLSSFTFNGKEYTTEMSDNPNYVGKRYQPLLNIREVLDKNMKVMSDSTRIEPYVGQIPGTIKRDK